MALISQASARPGDTSLSKKWVDKWPSPRSIFKSALMLLAVLFWCFIVWCGMLGGSVEGAVLGK
jgi:hypothetical protein